jgi:hypothetical protein
MAPGSSDVSRPGTARGGEEGRSGSGGVPRGNSTAGALLGSGGAARRNSRAGNWVSAPAEGGRGFGSGSRAAGRWASARRGARVVPLTTGTGGTRRGGLGATSGLSLRGGGDGAGRVGLFISGMPGASDVAAGTEGGDTEGSAPAVGGGGGVGAGVKRSTSASGVASSVRAAGSPGGTVADGAGAGTGGAGAGTGGACGGTGDAGGGTGGAGAGTGGAGGAGIPPNVVDSPPISPGPSHSPLP